MISIEFSDDLSQKYMSPAAAPAVPETEVVNLGFFLPEMSNYKRIFYVKRRFFRFPGALLKWRA